MWWLKALLGIGVLIAGGAVVYNYVNRQNVKKEAQSRLGPIIKNSRRCSKYRIKGQEPFACIKDVSQTSVGVGICDSEGELDSFRMNGEYGVDSDLYPGQIIPLEV